MAIDTVQLYNPKMTLPIYTQIALPKHNDYTVGDKYDMRIMDKERQQDKGGSGDYSYIHECLLIAKRKCTWGDLPDILKAFDGKAREKKLVHGHTHPLTGTMWEDEDDLIFLVYLRLDKAKEFILNDDEVVLPPWSEEKTEGDLTVEDYEGNG